MKETIFTKPMETIDSYEPGRTTEAYKICTDSDQVVTEVLRYKDGEWIRAVANQSALIAEYQSEISTCQSKIAILEAEKASHSGDAETIAKLQAQIDALQAQIDALNKKVSEEESKGGMSTLSNQFGVVLVHYRSTSGTSAGSSNGRGKKQIYLAEKLTDVSSKYVNIYNEDALPTSGVFMTFDYYISAAPGDMYYTSTKKVTADATGTKNGGPALLYNANADATLSSTGWVLYFNVDNLKDADGKTYVSCLGINAVTDEYHDSIYPATFDKYLLGTKFFAE